MNDNKTCTYKIAGIIVLLITALIWGFGFAAQRQSVKSLSPQIFLALRSLIAGIALLPVIAGLDRVSGRVPSLWGTLKTKTDHKTLLAGGFYCGIVLCCASLLQQWGLVYSSAGKGGFLTALYIVIVPLLGIFFKKKTTWLLWCAVALVLCGSYLLCGGNGFGKLNIGDLLLLLCAFGYAGHIMVIDHFATMTDGVRMSCIQFFICGVLALGGAAIAQDSWSWSDISAAMIPILYCGICSSGIGYTLQIIGQKYVHPVIASLLMSLESVFSVIGGYFVLGEVLTMRELTGCGIIFLAVLMAQIPLSQKK